MDTLVFHIDPLPPARQGGISHYRPYTNPESCFHNSYARVISTCTGNAWQNNLFEGDDQIKGHQYIRRS